jgi:hypothetical protein
MENNGKKEKNAEDNMEKDNVDNEGKNAEGNRENVEDDDNIDAPIKTSASGSDLKRSTTREHTLFSRMLLSSGEFDVGKDEKMIQRRLMGIKAQAEGRA